MFASVDIWLGTTVLGNFKKYPYPTTDSFDILTPVAFGNCRMQYSPCPQNC